MNSKSRAKAFFDQYFTTVYPQDIEFLTSQFDEVAAEQREACAKKAVTDLINKPRARYPEGTLSAVENACLNATGKI